MKRLLQFATTLVFGFAIAAALLFATLETAHAKAMAKIMDIKWQATAESSKCLPEAVAFVTNRRIDIDKTRVAEATNETVDGERLAGFMLWFPVSHNKNACYIVRMNEACAIQSSWLRERGWFTTCPAFEDAI